MAGRISKNLDIIANILIIFAALLLIIILIQRYFLPAFFTVRESTAPTIGKRFDLPIENFTDRKRTLVLALSTTCQYCTDSASFYKQLIQISNSKNIKIIGIFPQPVEEAKAYLSRSNLTGIEVKQSTLSSLNISGTPTLLLIDQNGEVLNFWFGKLSEEKEKEVVNNLLSE